MPKINSNTPDIEVPKTIQRSPQQQDFIDCMKKEKSNIILRARAGCGKTTTIMDAVQEIAANRLGQCAILAYNKSISEELKHRIQKMGIDWKQAEAGTVHSFGLRSWKKMTNPQLEIDGKKISKIIDPLIPSSKFLQRNAGVTARLISIAKGNGFGFFHAINDMENWFEIIEHFGIEEDLSDGAKIEELIENAIQIFKLSQEKDRSVIDFDDMILAPLTYNSPFWAYDFVFVDEAQDISRIRLALAMKMMKPKTGRLIAVGDDRQAIYGFTGADAESLNRIQKELNSKVLPLTVTYRCPKNIVKEANSLVADLTAHESAQEGNVRKIPFYSQDPVRIWYQTEKLSPQDSVILCRNVKPLIQLAFFMIKDGVGCRIEGREIGEGLIVLANRFKNIQSLDDLSELLSEYEKKKKSQFLAKGQEAKAQEIEDKCQTLQALIEGCMIKGQTDIYALTTSIRDLFGDTPPGTKPNVITLSTIHKSKGREWDNVYLLDREGTLPSKYARKQWQMVQEANLEYVAITRAKKQLTYIQKGR